MFIFTSQNSNNMRYEYRYEMRGFDGPTTRDNFRPIKTLMRMQSRGEFLTKEEKLEGKAYIWNENTLSWDINN